MSTSSSVPKPEITRDAIICDWKVTRKIGSGGFGAVYEVEKDGIRGALKTEFVDQTGERSETLRNEAGYSFIELIRGAPTQASPMLANRTSNATASNAVVTTFLSVVPGVQTEMWKGNRQCDDYESSGTPPVSAAMRPQLVEV
ncbi:hypothetical protein Y032_0538g3132 [Ancylostoma ceylanicum]|uniref:Protein kinase domain-containing protein n=1 Tax=Ancylostoma ceylanicum TaxID=53326 RepID=A0A016WRK3_9BILA|nr:hypothetical protein Y032_0538g3132 [Ancylostoma ceylanicum]